MIHAVIQRVTKAKVVVAEKTVGEIEKGLCVLAGFSSSDTPPLLEKFVQKIVHLRVFPDDAGKMNRSLLDISGELLLVSQFTLAGSIAKGRRPSFDNSMPPALARDYFSRLTLVFKQQLATVETGEFGADMNVSLTNWGPVTFHYEV